MFTKISNNLLFGASTLAAFFASTTMSMAHILTPYVCSTEDPDATSQYVTVPGGSGLRAKKGGPVLQVTTAANGNSSAGVVLSDIDSGNIFKVLTFDISGPADATDGPYVFVFGTHANGDPDTLFFPYVPKSGSSGGSSGTGFRNRKSGGGSSGSGTQSLTYKAPANNTDLKIDTIVIAFYPNSTSKTNTVSDVLINGSVLVAQMTTTYGCPAGSAHP